MSAHWFCLLGVATLIYCHNIAELSQRGRVGSKPACNGKCMLRSPPAVDWYGWFKKIYIFILLISYYAYTIYFIIPALLICFITVCGLPWQETSISHNIPATHATYRDNNRKNREQITELANVGDEFWNHTEKCNKTSLPGRADSGDYVNRPCVMQCRFY